MAHGITEECRDQPGRNRLSLASRAGDGHYVARPAGGPKRPISVLTYYGDRTYGSHSA